MANKKQFFVALDAMNRIQIMQEAKKILTEKGAHGVLLVNNGGRVSGKLADRNNLVNIALEVKNVFPEYLVGVNALDVSMIDAYRQVAKTKLDILWSDSGGITEDADGEAVCSKKFFEIKTDTKVKFFGGVAFKGQPQPRNLATVCEMATKIFDGVITSGPATGEPADPEKIYTMRKLVDPRKLGIASGLSVENLHLYKDADIFIVGTSLGDRGSFYYYSKQKVENFRTALDLL